MEPQYGSVQIQGVLLARVNHVACINFPYFFKSLNVCAHKRVWQVWVIGRERENWTDLIRVDTLKEAMKRCFQIGNVAVERA